MRSARLCMIAAILWLCRDVALAAPFQNGSFEPGPSQSISWSNTTEGWVGLTNIPANQIINGWTIDAPISWHSDVNAFGNTAELYFAPDGGHWFVDLKGNPDDPLGMVHQNFDTLPGATYEISFFLAAPGFQFADPRTVDVWVDLSEIHSFSTPAGQFGDMEWESFSFRFTAMAPITTLAFRAGSTSTGGGQYWGPVIDGVRVAVVPEPTSFGLASLATLGLVNALRRRGITF